MTAKTRFNRILLCSLGVAAVALAAVVFLSARQRDSRATASGALERQLAYQGRIALLRQIYAPVETLRQNGEVQAALLELARIEKDYPGEAYGQILKGEMQAQLGALDEAAASFAAGVRLNGDYVDRKSPLSRRSAIQGIVDAGLKSVAQRLEENPQNRTALETRKGLYYLQSRLAGGCE